MPNGSCRLGLRTENGLWMYESADHTECEQDRLQWSNRDERLVRHGSGRMKAEELRKVALFCRKCE